MLLKGLMKLRNDFEVVGDVRGKGLMIGLELVKDKVCEDNNSLQLLSLSLSLSFRALGLRCLQKRSLRFGIIVKTMDYWWEEEDYTEL